MAAEYTIGMTGVKDDKKSARRARLVLASQSARRRMLLDESGLGHEASNPGFEDSVLEERRAT